MKTTTTNNEIADWVLEAVKGWVDEDPDMSMDDLVADLLVCDFNYNNADPTSGQRCFQPHELESEIETALDYLKQDSDRCSGCGKIITDEEYVCDNELRVTDPYPMYENVVVGYKCSSCGEQENY